MAGIIGEGVSLRGFYFPNSSFTWNLSGSITSADIGKAMTQDTTANATAKLAGDGDIILGLLSSYENRVQEGIVVGAIAHTFSERVVYTGTIPALGTQVVGGATPGSVKLSTVALTTGYGRKPCLVVEQDSTNGYVTILCV